MYIANPIYDVVFKYLMDDSKIAKLIISSIIDQKIEDIDFRPQEYASDINLPVKKPKQTLSDAVFTVYRLDFSAKIKTSDGDKIVIIEVQKAKFPSDILRFRKYLGEQYANKENVYYVGDSGRQTKRACEIISIYFLGHELDNIHGVPVIKSKKTYVDVGEGKEIGVKEYFLDSLTHESYTIVIPALKERRRNELETLLSVFDQSNRTDDQHILNVKEEDFSEGYREIIRRLQRATSEEDIRKKMDIEDEILEDFADIEREIMLANALLEESEKKLVEKDKVIENKDKVIENKDKELENKDKMIEKTLLENAENNKLIELLKQELEKANKAK